MWRVTVARSRHVRKTAVGHRDGAAVAVGPEGVAVRHHEPDAEHHDHPEERQDTRRDGRVLHRARPVKNAAVAAGVLAFLGVIVVFCVGFMVSYSDAFGSDSDSGSVSVTDSGFSDMP